MGAQDLQITLTGKDLSASESFRALSRVAAFAARNIEGSMERVDRKINQTARSSSESITQQFGSKLTGWAQSGLAGIMGGIAASVTTSVTNVVADAGQAILSQLKTSVIDYNSTLENATIGFTTMLGSGQKASKFLNQLQDFGLKTPFQTDQLIQLSQQMMGYGVAAKNVIPYLTALGDATAASGRTDALPQATLAFEQMAARGRVDLSDMNQLTAAGVPALKILASAYDTTTSGILHMIHTGKLMSSDALPKLITGIEKGTKSTAAMGGMMEKQSKTFKGAMSNISDSLNRSLGNAFLPMFKVIERGAIQVQKFTSSKQFTAWASTTGRVVSRAMNLVGGALQKVFADPEVQKSIGRLGKSLGSAFQAVGPAVSKILPDLIRFGKDALPAIIDTMTAIVDKVPTLLKWWERLAGGLAAAGPAIAGTIRFLSNVGGTLFNLSATIGNFASDAVGAFTRFVDGSKTRLNDLVGWIGSVGQHIASGFLNGIVGAWGGVTSAVQGLINQIPLVVRKMLGIASPSKVFHQIGSWVGQGLQKGLLGSVSQISAASASMATAIRNQFANKKISKGVEQDALADLKRLTDSNSKLRRLSNERAELRDKLAGLRSDRTGVHDDVKAATVGAGDITSFAAPGDAVQGLQALVAKTKTFTTDLKALVKKGVGGAMLQQLVNGWQSDPDTALNTAQGLLSNPGDLKQILTLQKQLSSAGASLGAYAGHAEYDSQIGATAGKIKVRTWEMQRAAQATLRGVAKAGDIHLHLSGTYAGTKDDLAKTVKQAVHDAIKKGVIPKNWATG